MKKTKGEQKKAKKTYKVGNAHQRSPGEDLTRRVDQLFLSFLQIIAGLGPAQVLKQGKT